ncbi:MAG: octaprenyl diphosphate synthase [Betaproteobacteria bacterium]
MSLDDIRRLVADDMQAVDAVIRGRLHSEVVLVQQVSEYIIGSGGKRLRPILLILGAGACDHQGAHVHELAAVVEFIHTATLLHDDVVDGSEMRRGKATANASFGNPASVLVGDFLYSRAFQMMVSVRNMRVMEVLAEATNVIAEGEVLQLMNVHDADVTEEAYLHVIRYKTAKLFQAAGRLGPVLAGAPAPKEAALADYGMHLGTAFQLIDDVLDYSGDLSVTGKNLGDDLAEGKPTLPLIHAMRTGNPQQAAVVRRAIEDGGVTDFTPVMDAILATRALDYARTVAEREARLAQDALAPFSHSQYRESLINLAAFSVSRTF